MSLEAHPAWDCKHRENQLLTSLAYGGSFNWLKHVATVGRWAGSVPALGRLDFISAIGKLQVDQRSPESSSNVKGLIAPL